MHLNSPQIIDETLPCDGTFTCPKRLHSTQHSDYAGTLVGLSFNLSADDEQEEVFEEEREDEELLEMYVSMQEISSSRSARGLLDCYLEKLDALPYTHCKKDVFYIDWGSSGMKVYMAHFGSGRVKYTYTTKVRHVNKDNVLQVLEKLESKLVHGHRGGVMLSTAGTRILGNKNRRDLWSKIRKWNQKNKLFEQCDTEHNESCRTLPGSQEAFQETYGMEKRAQRLKKKLGKPFGMASCGGASLQLSIVGGQKDLLDKCASDLENLDQNYNPEPVAVKKNGIYLSWLANHNVLIKSNKSGKNRYVAGGVNEMRAQFDSWLLFSNKSTNPCLSHGVNSLYRHSDVCESYGSKGGTCLVDRYNAYISGLPGGNNTVHQCRTAAYQFLETDFMLNEWRRSSSCMSLAKSVKQWGLVSAFSRDTQLGYSTDSNPQFGEVEHCGLQASPGDVSISVENYKQRKVGELLTSALLTQFLMFAGLQPSARVMALNAGPIAYELNRTGLEWGWMGTCA